MANQPKKSLKTCAAPQSPIADPTLTNIAQRLRQVRQASRDFLLLWASEQLVHDSQAMHWVASDVAELANQTTEAGLADPYNHNWSILYRGSVLDD